MAGCAHVRSRDPIRGPREAAGLLRCLTQHLTASTRLLVVGLGPDRRVTGVAIAAPGRGLADLKVWELHALAVELEAQVLVMGRFARSHRRPPSAGEVRAFVDLARRAGAAGVVLLDCIVLRRHQWWSLAERAAAKNSVTTP